MDVWTIWISPPICRRLQLDRFAIVRFEWQTVIGNGGDRLKRRDRNKANGPFGRCTVFTHEHPVYKRAHITRMSSIRAARRSVIYVALWKCHGRCGGSGGGGIRTEAIPSGNRWRWQVAWPTTNDRPCNKGIYRNNTYTLCGMKKINAQVAGRTGSRHDDDDDGRDDSATFIVRNHRNLYFRILSSVRSFVFFSFLFRSSEDA